MIPCGLLQDGLLFPLLLVGLLCLLLCHQVSILAPATSTLVMVVIKEGLIVVIMTVMLIIMLVGSTAGLPVPWRYSMLTC
jgi:hypothetical protein